DLAAFAYHVDRPISRDGRHPCDRRGQSGIELSGAAPDLHVRLLNDLLCEILSPQDTEHHAKEFRTRRGVEALECRLLALCTRGNQPDQLCWRQHEVPQYRAAAPVTPRPAGFP